MCAYRVLELSGSGSAIDKAPERRPSATDLGGQLVADLAGVDVPSGPWQCRSRRGRPHCLLFTWQQCSVHIVSPHTINAAGGAFGSDDGEAADVLSCRGLHGQ